MNKNKGRIIIVIVSVLILVGAGGTAQFLSSKKKPPEKQKAEISTKYVQTQMVDYQVINTKVTAYGRAGSSQPLDIMSEVAGRMLAGNIPLKAGQKFGAGTVLFRIDDTEAKLTLQAQKSGFMRDIATILADFKIDFSESYQAWQNYFDAMDVKKPLPELPEPKNNKEKTYLATKNIFTNYYNIKSTEERLTKYVYRAPFAGTIAEIFLETGSYVNPAGKIAKIIRTDKLELKVPIETNNIEWVKIGTPVKVSSENGNMKWDGKVTRIGDLVNPQTQALDVFMNIIPNQHKVYDGLYLKVEIDGATISEGMEVSRSALVDRTKLYVINAKDSILTKKRIQIHKSDEETVIFSGLEPDTEIVTEPLAGISEDTKVAPLRTAAEAQRIAQEKAKQDSLKNKDKKSDE